MEDFPTLGLQKKAYRKIYMRTQEIYSRKNNVQQEAYKRWPREVLAVLKV